MCHSRAIREARRYLPYSPGQGEPACRRASGRVPNEAADSSGPGRRDGGGVGPGRGAVRRLEKEGAGGTRGEEEDGSEEGGSGPGSCLDAGGRDARHSPVGANPGGCRVRGQEGGVAARDERVAGAPVGRPRAARPRQPATQRRLGPAALHSRRCGCRRPRARRVRTGGAGRNDRDGAEVDGDVGHVPRRAREVHQGRAPGRRSRPQGRDRHRGRLEEERPEGDRGHPGARDRRNRAWTRSG